MRPKYPRAVRAILGLGLVCALVGCFDPPVREEVILEFLGDGDLAIHLRVDLAEADGSHEVIERIEAAERSLLSGTDPWSRRFQALRSATEDLAWHKVEGQLRRLGRSSTLAAGLAGDPEKGLPLFFRDTPIHLTYGVDVAAGNAELAIYPGASDRATRREHRRVEEAIDLWSEAILVYLSEAEAAWRYLEARPGRAEVFFGEIFDHELELPAATEEEMASAEALVEAMSTVFAVLEVDERRAESLDELSRRVFDPFPAPLAVSLPSPALEVEGFIEVGEQWIVPGLSLWSALEELGGQWLWPDPLLAIVEHDRYAGDVPFDLRAFAAEPRRASPPVTADEIASILRNWLRPEDVYRLSWRAPTSDEDGEPAAEPGAS